MSCSECPVKQAQEEFEAAVSEDLEERLGKNYSVGSLIGSVLTIAELRDTDPSTWTIATARLVAIYRGEENRIDRIKRWNERQTKQ